MASIGHDIVGIDVDPRRIDALSKGEAPFFEPGLQQLLTAGIESGRLRFTTDIAEASGAAVHFIAVGTPQERGGYAADLTHVNASVDALLPFLRPGDVVAGKSTVPVGTAFGLAPRIEATGATLVWNPEFLREGWAVKDTIEPDRLVVGVGSARSRSSQNDRAAEILREVYHPAVARGTPFIVTDWATAELVKVAANAFLATKISFINAMAEIAEVTGADVTQLADAIGHDARIGRRFLGAGIGFGGGCLPKDIRAFAARAEELGRGESIAFLREVDAINLRRRDRAVELVVAGLGGSVFEKRITVLGAAFKPHSDDVRDSPGLDVAVRLRGLGAEVTVTDPAAIDNARRLHPQLTYVEDRDDAIRHADAVVLVTEWDEYRRRLSPEHASTLTAGRVIVDGRNGLDAAAWRAGRVDVLRHGEALTSGSRENPVFLAAAHLGIHSPCAPRNRHPPPLVAAHRRKRMVPPGARVRRHRSRALVRREAVLGAVALDGAHARGRRPHPRQSSRLRRRGPRNRRHRSCSTPTPSGTPDASAEENPLKAALRWVGEVTGFGPSSPHTLVKRVIGAPGQTVECCTDAGARHRRRSSRSTSRT